MNAKNELLDELKNCGKKIEDIEALAIQVTTDGKYKFERKCILIKNILEIEKIDVDYDDGYGSQNLFGTVLFKDNTWLERYEYDGSESWDYKEPPTKEQIERLAKAWETE